MAAQGLRAVLLFRLLGGRSVGVRAVGLEGSLLQGRGFCEIEKTGRKSLQSARRNE